MQAVHRFLSKRKDVDDDRVAVFGYGEGASVALIAASRDQEIAALVLAAGASGSGADLVLEQQQALLAASSCRRKTGKRAWHSSGACRQPCSGRVTGQDVPDDVRRQADTPWFRSFLAFDPAKVIERLRQPILIIQGERDTQVPPHHADTLAELARARKKVPADSVRLVKLPGVNHLLVPADTGNVTESASLAGRSVSSRSRVGHGVVSEGEGGEEGVRRGLPANG